MDEIRKTQKEAASLKLNSNMDRELMQNISGKKILAESPVRKAHGLISRQFEGQTGKMVQLKQVMPTVFEKAAVKSAVLKPSVKKAKLVGSAGVKVQQIKKTQTAKPILEKDMKNLIGVQQSLRRGGEADLKSLQPGQTFLNNAARLIDIQGMAVLAGFVTDHGAITYKDLMLSIKDVVSIRKVDISQVPGDHGRIHVEAILDSEMEENDFHLIQEQVFLTYQNGNDSGILFFGVIDQISMDKEGDEWILYIDAWDSTRGMDTQRKNRTFQNPKMMISELLDKVMSEYQNSDYMLHIPDEPIGQLVVQYEETDWEFLKRFLSKYNVTLYPDTSYPVIRFQVGISPVPEAWKWDDLPYEISQDFNWLESMKQNGFGELLPAQSISYRLESYDIAVLGSQITYKGVSWYLGAVRRYLLDGNLRNEYCLKQKEGFKIIPYYNERLTGISIDGLISDVKRDRVQINMEIDAGSGGTDNYWFPFSTVASSSDGSGWYCMPEQGESVRVFFPIDDEKESYVITNIKAHDPENGGADDPMGNPDTRSIATEQGNQVQFTEEGVLIEAGEGQGTVLINKDGSVVLDGLLDITLDAGEAIQFMAKNEVTLTSQTAIKVINDTGSDIEMKSGEVKLHGLLIQEN